MLGIKGSKNEEAQLGYVRIVAELRKTLTELHWPQGSVPAGNFGPFLATQTWDPQTTSRLMQPAENSGCSVWPKGSPSHLYRRNIYKLFVTLMALAIPLHTHCQQLNQNLQL